MMKKHMFQKYRKLHSQEIILMGKTVSFLFLSLFVFVAKADLVRSIDLEDAQFSSDENLYDNSKEYIYREDGGAYFPQIKWSSFLKTRTLRISSAPTPTSNGATKDRSEYRIYSQVDYDKTWYLGFRMFIADILSNPGGTSNPDNWHLLMQCFQQNIPGGSNPILSFNFTENGDLALVSRSTLRGPVDSAEYFKSHASVPIIKGRWLKVILRFKLKTGSLKFWYENQVQSITDNYSMMGHSGGDENKCTLKMGMYRGATTKAHEIRFDNIRLGDSYGSVKSW